MSCNIDYLVTVVTLKDLYVLSYGIENINIYIKPKYIVVSTPDSDYMQVKKILQGSNIVLYKDSEIISEDEQKIIKTRLEKLNFKMWYGWYIQQFIKIKLSSNWNDNAMVLIWDSDTVPLRPLNFILNGKIQYFVSNEYHEAYFNTLRNILSIEKLTTYSFISQCFPLRSYIAKRFILDLGQENWISNIMLNLSSISPHSFSEYEMLGNYIIANEFYDIEFNHSMWLRDGAKLYFRLGSIKKVIEVCKDKYSYVAFEKINRSRFRYYLGNLKSFLINLFS